MAKNGEVKNRAKALASSLKSQLAPPIARVIVSFIPVEWLKKNMDLIDLGPVVAWIVNEILPDEGLGQEISDVTSDVLAADIKSSAQEKVDDAKDHPNPKDRRFPDRKLALQQLKLSGPAGAKLAAWFERKIKWFETVLGTKIQAWNADPTFNSMATAAQSAAAKQKLLFEKGV